MSIRIAPITDGHAHNHNTANMIQLVFQHYTPTGSHLSYGAVANPIVCDILSGGFITSYIMFSCALISRLHPVGLLPGSSAPLDNSGALSRVYTRTHVAGHKLYALVAVDMTL